MNTCKVKLVALLIMTGLVACKKDNETVEDFKFTPAIVWNKMNHVAFTDLVRFKDAFYITFREAASHNSTASSVGC